MLLASDRAGSDADVAIVGAGVVGLSVALRLAEAGRSVLVLERHEGPGRETSSRNSEVIHAGIYYPPGSLKARLCVRGNRLLYDFCEKENICCKRTGKLIVATSSEEVETLEALCRRGGENGVVGLRLLTSREVGRLEPRIKARAAVHSPTTGILDSHALIKALEAETRAHGGQIAFCCRVCSIEASGSNYLLTVQNPSGTEEIRAGLLVNAAGLESDRIAAMAGVPCYRLHWCKGEYYAVVGAKARMISRLVYPVPGPALAHLGIHATVCLDGRMRLGPDSTYVTDRDRASLDVDPDKADAFCRAVSSFLPGLLPEDLQPDTAGIRPKLQGPGEPWKDFVIQEESANKRPGLVNLVGLESPGLTACLAIAERVLDIVK